MAAKVFFIQASAKENLEKIHHKILLLYRQSMLDSCFEKDDFVALKIHFGEDGNTTHIPANYFNPIIQHLNKKGAKPFFTDTCVLYRGQRSNAVNHLKVAEKHGFSLANTGAPVVIADGLRGRNEIEVEINAELFEKVSIATEAVVANAMIVATHITGHMASGLGGAIKNIGMGLASRKGKLRQHSSVSPWIEGSHCTGCGECILWCPENAISMNGNIAVIDKKLCIGCGECLTVCNFEAVKYNWKTSSQDLQKKMAEHALGAIKNKIDKTCFFNFLTNITPDCDCFSTKQQLVMNDIGILASRDPVAIDKAALDLIEEQSGKTLTSMSYPAIDPLIQLKHGEKIGLGEMNYELIRIDEK